jgi:dynein heavy chain
MQEPGVHPGPLVELDFWTERAANLNSIHDQLQGEKIQKVTKVLQLVKSTYYPSFSRLIDEVEAARQEANDNVKFLKPLRKHFEKLNLMDEFPSLVELFKPVMHLIMLVWKHSKHYNAPARLVTLLREVCNDLIMQVGCSLTSGADDACAAAVRNGSSCRQHHGTTAPAA